AGLATGAGAEPDGPLSDGWLGGGRGAPRRRVGEVSGTRSSPLLGFHCPPGSSRAAGGWGTHLPDPRDVLFRTGGTAPSLRMTSRPGRLRRLSRESSSCLISSYTRRTQSSIPRRRRRLRTTTGLAR